MFRHMPRPAPALKSTTRTAVVAVMAMSIAACSTAEEFSRGAGTVIGGVFGAWLGSNVGKGTGRAAAIALGAGLGALMGDEIARRLTEKDRELAGENLRHTLENEAPGNRVSWSNPDSKNTGNAMAGETYQQASRDCRDFETTVFTDEGSHVATGTACRNDDGSWEVTQEPSAG